ncbi:hypothetical protein GCM10009616_40300 [Microlunatus lacustris]
MSQIPDNFFVTTYAGTPGVHLVGQYNGALRHLCPASRDQYSQIRHYWTVHAIEAPDAPTVDCRHCTELLQLAVTAASHPSPG